MAFMERVADLGMRVKQQYVIEKEGKYWNLYELNTKHQMLVYVGSATSKKVIIKHATKGMLVSLIKADGSRSQPADYESWPKVERE